MTEKKNDKNEDPKYLELKAVYDRARNLLPIKEKAQFEDKKWLKKVADPNLRKLIRHRLAERRRGPTGLKTLQKSIKSFYKYCSDMGY